MTVGIASAHATAILNLYKGTTYTAPSGIYVQLHTADPGAAGTTAVSAVTTRNQITWGTVSAGSLAMSSIGSYSMTSSETITHISLWGASSGGTFYQSLALTSSVPVVNGTTLSFSAISVAYSPLAA